MAYSGRVLDYLGEGLAADRPASLNLAPGAIGFWRSTDTGALAVWSDGDWHDFGGEGSTNLDFTRTATTVTVNSDTGTDAVLPAATSSLAGVMSAADKAKLDAAGAPVAAITTATHNLVAADVGKYNRTTYAGAATVTVQTNAAEAIAVGSEVHFRAVGGALTLTPASGVTLNAPAGGTLVVPQHGTVTLKKVATNEWDVIGVTEAP